MKLIASALCMLAWSAHAGNKSGADFDFAKGLCGWQATNGAQLATGSNCVIAAFPRNGGLIVAPPVQINADEENYVSLRLIAENGTEESHGTLFFGTEGAPGWQRLNFPVHVDGQKHTYNIDLLNNPKWHGRITRLGVGLENCPNAQAKVRWLKVSDSPQGEPQLNVKAFAVEDTLPRPGRAVKLTAVLANNGGETASNITATLSLPTGVRLVSAPPAGSLAALGFGEEARVTWTIQASAALDDEIGLNVKSANNSVAGSRTPLVIRPSLNLAKANYVPEPKPIRGPYEVGVYYFPGWKDATRWEPIRNFPERKPALGWYREGDPELADWQIKWAVEHGITFFAYDWYWSQGGRSLEHALHEGYFKARYRNLLKFCLLWANHNAPKTSSIEDCVAVTRYWIENYFRRPEYLTINGKPVIIIFSPHRLTEDLGSDGVKRAFAAMRQECSKAGLKGLCLMACIHTPAQAQRAGAEDYDAVTGYNWPGLGISGSEKFAPFETLVEGYRTNWLGILEKTPVPLMLPVSGGWDSRPWHGDNNLVRFDRNPDLFRKHLQDAKQVLDSGRGKLIRSTILIEAWNEWGEGSYIEPHSQYGFDYLDAIRTVFVDGSMQPAHPHMDVTPSDVGLGPYDVPETKASSKWTFDGGAEGWSGLMQMEGIVATNGVLVGFTKGKDPALSSPPMHLRATEFTAVTIRMKLQHTNNGAFKDTAQLFWRTQRQADNELASIRFEVPGDGQWHDYKLPVAPNRLWRGIITGLRLDPCTQPEVKVEIDRVELSR